MAKRQKEHSLTGRIPLPLMHAAFKKVKRNRGAAGIDKLSIRLFEANLEENLLALMRDLTSGEYEPMPLRRVHILKDLRSNRTRPLGIPAVRDRVAQEVVRMLLEPIFEPQLHESSHGFQPQRSGHTALDEVLALHHKGSLTVLDGDVEGFFDNIPHDVIMQLGADQVADGNILGLVQRFLTAGVMEEGVFKPTTVATPQGGIISPLLANIVLNQLDWELDRAGFHFVRYADDFVVLTRSPERAQEALILVQHVLGSRLQLRLNREKTRIATYKGKGNEFLGFSRSHCSRRMRDKSLQKFKDKVRALTVRHENLDQDVIMKLNQVIRATALYFAPEFATNRRHFPKLDSWIRMRLRAMKLERKSYRDNYKLRAKYFGRKLGLLTLESFCLGRDASGQVCSVIPRYGATSRGSPGE